MYPIVAIIGRPNVGKSTLFNRLIAYREAIVDDSPGITRDRHYGTVEWCGHMFTVIDTGGYMEDPRDPITTQVKAQAILALQEADLVLWMVDAQEGLTAQDLALADLMRKSQKPILVVANKTDNAICSLQALSFHSLGMGNLYEISATHGSGTGDLLDAVVACLPSKQATSSITDLPRIALVGRPNVGKSTLMNAFLGKARSIVHAMPHTTRTPVHSVYRLFKKELLLIDTAGIARKSQVKPHAIACYALVRAIRAIEQSDVCLVLIDAKEGLTDQDKNILRIAYNKKKGIVVLVNKWDQIAKDQHTATTYRETLCKDLAYLYYVPIMFVSGLYKKRIYHALDKALVVYQNRCQHLSTAKLNKILQHIVQKTPPPSPRGRLIRLNYATQLPAAWPVFAIFCNLPQHIPTNYKRFLEKQLRTFVAYEGVPITLSFRKK